MPSNLVPSTFLKHFRGERGCPWYGPSAYPGRHVATKTLRYKCAFRVGTRYASLDLYSWGIGEGPAYDQDGTWYSTSAKPERHSTKGMFGKPLFLPRLEWLERRLGCLCSPLLLIPCLVLVVCLFEHVPGNEANGLSCTKSSTLHGLCIRGSYLLL